VADLLCLLPQRYEDRSAIRPIGTLVPGEKVLVEGTIELAEVVLRRRRSLLCRLADGTGALTLRFFHFHDGQKRGLARGLRVRAYGEVRPGPTGLEMVHPEHRTVAADEGEPAALLTAVYHRGHSGGTTNGQDGIYADGGVTTTLRVSELGSGYLGTLNLGIRR
jgi:ATP-dependent DNA helicase RecG